MKGKFSKRVMALVLALVLALTVLVLISGCNPKAKPTDKRIEVVAVYYKGSATDFDYFARGNGNQRLILNNISANRMAIITADITGEEEEYVVLKDYRWDVDYKIARCDRVEIHLRPTSVIAGGVIDRGKFGIQRVSVVR